MIIRPYSTYNIQCLCRIKVIVYNLGGELSLWNRIWDLGWFWAGGSTENFYNFFKVPYFWGKSFYVFMSKMNKKLCFLDIVSPELKSWLTWTFLTFGSQKFSKIWVLKVNYFHLPREKKIPKLKSWVNFHAIIVLY